MELLGHMVALFLHAIIMTQEKQVYYIRVLL